MNLSRSFASFLAFHLFLVNLFQLFLMNKVETVFLDTDYEASVSLQNIFCPIKKWRYNKPPKPIFHTKHKFCIIFIYSNSPRSIFKKSQYIFCRKLLKLDATKTRIFSLTFHFVFTNNEYSYQKLFVVPQLSRRYHTFTKGVAVRRSSNQNDQPWPKLFHFV